MSLQNVFPSITGYNLLWCVLLKFSSFLFPWGLILLIFLLNFVKQYQRSLWSRSCPLNELIHFWTVYSILHVLCFLPSLVKTPIIPGPFVPWRLFLPVSFRLIFLWLQITSSLACSDKHSEDDSEREDPLQIFRALSLCNFLFSFTLPCELQIPWSPPSRLSFQLRFTWLSPPCAWSENSKYYTGW